MSTRQRGQRTGRGVSGLGEEFAGAVQAFAERVVPSVELRRLLDSDAFPTEAWHQMASDGWFRAQLPETADGFGLGLADLGPTFRSIGQSLLPGPLLDHVVGLPLVYESCDTDVGRLLEPALDGSRLVALADPAVDVDAAVRTSGVRSDGARIDGQVAYVRWAGYVDDFIVLGDDDVVLVHADDPSVRVEGTCLDDTSRLGTVTFAETVCTPLVSGDPARQLSARLRHAIGLLAACELAGIAERLCDMAVDHAGQREQFGRPIGSFQAIKHLLADLTTQVTALGNLIEQSLQDVADDPAALPLTSATAKCYASSVSRRAAEDALQVLGGIGFTAEHDLHLYFKRVLTLQGLYGDERELAVTIGREMLERGRVRNVG